MNPTKDFEELFSFLNAHDVRAIRRRRVRARLSRPPALYQGHRHLLEPTRENATRTLAALSDFGFGGLGLDVEDFSTPDQVVQLGVPPNRVDLMTSIEAVTFAEAWSGRVAGHYGTQPVFFLGRDEFIKNKRAVGRPQDLADIDDLL